MSDVVRRKESVIKVIRSLLISSPSGLTLNQLERDYQLVENQGLPYRKFGHTDLLSFVKTLSDVVKIDYRNRELVLYGIADEKTKHIKSMVDHQRKTSRYMGLAKVNQPSRRPKSGPFGARQARGVCYVSAQIRRNVYNVVQSNVNGVPMSVFLDVYKQENGVTLNPERLGFKRLPDIFLSMPDVCKLEYGRRDKTGNTLYVYPPKLQQGPAISKTKTKVSGGDSKSPSVEKPASRKNSVLNSEESVCVNEEKPAIAVIKSELNPPVEDKIFSNSVIPSCKLLRSEILEILAEEPKGVWAVRVPVLYKKKFGKELQIQKVGYFSIIELLSTLSDEVSITRPNPKGDWLLAKRNVDEIDQSKLLCGSFYNEGLEVLKMEVKEMLIKSKDGILLDRLSEIYEKTFRHTLHLDEYNISNSLEFVVMIRGVCIYEKDGKIYVTLTEDEKKAIHGGYISPNLPENDIPLDAIGPNASYKLPTLPSKDAQYIDLFVSDVTNPEYFMVQICSKQTTGALNMLMDELERFYCSPEGDRYKIPECMITIGQLCAAVFMEDMNWHRAVIVRINKASYADVLYVDYGSISAVPIASLRLLKSCFLQLPSQMIKARLAHIQPANLKSWTLDSRNCMLDMCRDRPLVAMITSIENRVLSLCLCDTTNPDTDLHINDTLVEKKHAVYFPDDLPKEAASTLKSFLQQQNEVGNKGPSWPCSTQSITSQPSDNLDPSPDIASKNEVGNDIDESYKPVAQPQIRFVRLFSIIEGQYSINVINYEGNPMVTSADISLFFQPSGDDLVPLLLMRNLRFIELAIADDEKHSQLFIEMREKNVPGTIRHYTYTSIVFLYRLQDVPAIIKGIGHAQEKDLIDGVKKILIAFDPDSRYWISDDEDDCPELISVAQAGNLELSKLEHEKEELFNMRKNLLEQLANQSSASVVDQTTDIEEKLFVIKGKIKQLSCTLPKEIETQAQQSAVHDAMVSQYTSHAVTVEKKSENLLTESSQICSKSDLTRVAEVVPFMKQQEAVKTNLDTDFSEISGAHLSHDVVDFTTFNLANEQLPPLIHGSSGSTNWRSTQVSNQVVVDGNEHLPSRIFIPQTMRESFTQPMAENIPFMSPQSQNAISQGSQVQLPIGPRQWRLMPLAQQRMNHNAPQFFPNQNQGQVYYNQMAIPATGTVNMQHSQQLVYTPQNRQEGQYSLFMPVQGMP
uniref:tudor domain-containing protein 5-like n=1 Tax=Styela clava TaxID=7725 RepID=UPI001939D358|nr:tudor domain-containing protein 5-like [Styela clava]